MKANMTTIALSKELKEELKEYGNKSETYEDIIKRLMDSAKERMLHDLLFNQSDSVPIEKAIAWAKKKWPE